MAMYLGKERAVILSQKYTAEKFTIRKTLNFGGLSQSTLFRVKKVKGATVKSKNLIPYPYHETTKTQNGITFTDNGDGSITVNGTATESASFYLKMRGSFPVGTYTISGKKDGIIINARKNGTSWIEEASWSSPTGQFNEGDVFDFSSIYVPKGTVANNVRIYPMFNEGETALPYQPYFTGLKHAYINAIKSTGKNLFNKETATKGQALNVDTGGWYNSAERLISDYIQVSENSKYYINWVGIRWGCCYDSNKQYLGEIVRTKNYILTPLPNTAYIRITANLDELNTIMLNQGETELPFEPYKEDIWQLPETLELGEWDELNPPTGEVTRATERIVFDGTEAWFSGLSNKSGVYRKAILGLILGTNSVPAVVSNVISTHYETLSGDDTYLLNKGISMHGGDMYIYDPDFDTSDISLWKAHLAELYANGNPLTVAYEKVEPTVEKIEGCPLAYTALKGGTETVIQGEENNSQFKAIPTIETGHTVIMELIIGDENG